MLAVIDYEWTVWGYHLPTDIAHQQLSLVDAELRGRQSKEPRRQC